MSWAAAQTVITSKGQVVIPAQIRRRFGIEPGQRFKVIEEEGTIRLIPVKTMTLDEARGSMKTRKTTKELLTEARRQEAMRDKRLTEVARKNVARKNVATKKGRK